MMMMMMIEFGQDEDSSDGAATVEASHGNGAATAANPADVHCAAVSACLQPKPVQVGSWLDG